MGQPRSSANEPSLAPSRVPAACSAAIDWLAVTGAVTEASYPYVSGGGTAPPCTSGHVAAPTNVTGWRLVPGNTSAAVETALAAWLAAYGPVSILVDAMTQLWWPYSGGVMTGW